METCSHHQDIAEDLKEIKTTLTEIHKKLFVDNGTESLQTFVVNTRNWICQHDKHAEQKVGFWYWVIPIFVSVMIVILDKIL